MFVSELSAAAAAADDDDAAAAPEASADIPIHAKDNSGIFVCAAIATCDTGTGKTHGEQSSSHGERSMADFEVVKHLGRGAFGQVLEVRKFNVILCGLLRFTLKTNVGCGKTDEEGVRIEGDTVFQYSDECPAA
jgi:hypothetical protein